MPDETKLDLEQNPPAGSPPPRTETYRYYYPPGTANPIVLASSKPSSWSSASAAATLLAFPLHWRKYEATVVIQDIHPDDYSMPLPRDDAKLYFKQLLKEGLVPELGPDAGPQKELLKKLQDWIDASVPHPPDALLDEISAHKVKVPAVVPVEAS